MPAEKKLEHEEVSDIASSLTALREAVESKTLSESEIKAITTKCEKRLADFDAANDKMVAAMQTKDDEYKALESKIIDLETKLSRVSFGGAGDQTVEKGRAELNVFLKYAKYGPTWLHPESLVTMRSLTENKGIAVNDLAYMTMKPDEIKLLRTDINDQGGLTKIIESMNNTIMLIKII